MDVTVKIPDDLANRMEPVAICRGAHWKPWRREYKHGRLKPD